MKEGKLLYKGKVGAEVSLEQAMEAAKTTVINALAILKGELGNLERIKRVVKVTGYVASAAGFNMQANVLNGASQFLYEVFGDKGIHARAAVGVYELPLDAPVEVEFIIEVTA